MTPVCACGCGCVIPDWTCRPRPQRIPIPQFIQGHWFKVYRRQHNGKDYKELGRERLHRVLAEKALGHPLPAGAEVHHADGSQNPSAQLVICPSRSYHQLLHVRMRIQAAGGNPNTQKLCGMCKQPKLLTEFYALHGKRQGQYSGYCRSCSAEANHV